MKNLTQGRYCQYLLLGLLLLLIVLWMPKTETPPIIFALNTVPIGTFFEFENDICIVTDKRAAKDSRLYQCASNPGRIISTKEAFVDIPENSIFIRPGEPKYDNYIKKYFYRAYEVKQGGAL